MPSKIFLVLLASAGLIDARTVLHERYSQVHKRANDASGTTLSANAIQSGSFNDGSDEIGSAEAGQAKSLTSTNNFINNCAGKTLTNGLQITTGSCNGITMGDIPAKSSMVSSIITFPLAGSASIQSDTTFNISVQTSNLVAGSFTNADATYYAAPQALSGGKVVGHTHVTVQDLGSSLNPATALDPTQFAFFKGINDAGNGNGLLQAVVTGGLPAGHYRVCTMASASNHQPVLMPVAQRGTADDCTKFTVVGSGSTANAASNNGSGGKAAAALAASAVAAGPDVAESTAVSSASSASTTSNGNNENGGNTSKSPSINSTSSAFSTSAGQGTNGGGKAGQSESGASSTASAVSASLSSSQASGNGNTSGNSSAGSASKQVVAVIETFFEFKSSLGGLCPSVSKLSGSFSVLGELFEDLQSAAAASCGHQFDACVGISGPRFSVEECSSQKDLCRSAASTASSLSTPSTITTTISVPVTVPVTGSILSSTVVSSTNLIATSSAAVAQITAAQVVGNAASASSSPCVSTHTITLSPSASSTASSQATNSA